ncbi:hypothetical protein [Candidatus Hodgkinia cicadicola]
MGVWFLMFNFIIGNSRCSFLLVSVWFSTDDVMCFGLLLVLVGDLSVIG